MSKPGAIDSPVSYDALLKEDEMADEKEVSRRLSRKDFVIGGCGIGWCGRVGQLRPGRCPGADRSSGPYLSARRGVSAVRDDLDPREVG
jgi:hypothetical protein